jgi:tetratricopeptide (TPR) repeat protein
MTGDPYSNCPCGSGKKLKFCCGDILPELIKVHRLQENQPEVAEKALRDLLKKAPNREVLVGELASVLRNAGKLEDAKALVSDFLKQYPDHPRGLVWLARLCLLQDGFEASRRLVHRTFQISSKRYAGEIAELANAIGLYMASNREVMGGREHLALAARLAGPDRSRQFLMSLAMLESDQAIPYPLRTPYALLPVSGSVESMQQDQRAKKLSAIGCWEPAAILYSRMAEASPENGEIWYNFALCRAWDGRSLEAAGLMHKAAGLLEDQNLAVEAESLAMILDQQTPDRQYHLVRYQFNVSSASELISKLEDNGHFHRFHDDDEEEAEASESRWPSGMDRVAMFDLLDKFPLEADSYQSADQFPEVLADIDLIDIVDENSASAAGFRTPILQISVIDDLGERVLGIIQEACGELISSREGDKPVAMPVVTQPKDAREFDNRIHCPATVSKRRFRELTENSNEQLAERWMQRPVMALDGKTPLDAARDPALKRQVAASVLALEANAMYFDRPIRLAFVRGRLGIAEPTKIALSAGQHCSALSAFALQRIDAAALDDGQLQEFCNRTSMMGFVNLARLGLDELLRRPEASGRFGRVRACLMRASIARSDNDRATLAVCLQSAREAASQSKESFRELLELEIRELAMRLDDPEDPALIDLLHRIRDRYLTKLPEIGNVIASQLLESGCEHLIAELESPLAMASDSKNALWTPGSSEAASTSDAGGGLWLPPGQE